MTSKAFGLAQLGNVFDDGALSNRNLIINGAMQVAQRGTSVTGLNTTIGYFTVDRFRFADAGSPTAVFTQSQDTNAPDGFATSLKMLVTTIDASVAATTQQYIDQFIEAQNLQQLAWNTASSGKVVTLSFYVKCSTAQTFAIDFVNEDNSRYFNTTYTVDAADTWERKTITIPADASNGFNNDDGRGLRLRWTLVAGTNYTTGSVSTTWSSSSTRASGHENTWVGTTSNYWQITGVQLEVGDTATPFEHRSYGDELARCQRYYFNSDEADSYISAFDVTSGNTYYFTIMNPVTMRTSPTITLINENYSNFDGINVIRNYATRWGGSDTATGSGRGYFQFEYTADAEF